MSIAKKRLLKDIANLHDAKLNDSGIYFHVSEDNMFEIVFLFIGRKGTPYEHGSYFFKLNADKSNYPFIPPKVIFYPLSHKRIHPNFYVCGKVCLSILNTWSGPQWSPSQTLLSIAITIQSVLDSTPLMHEPGFENDTHEQIKFNKFVQYENFSNIIKLFNTDLSISFPPFACFRQILCEYYRENFNTIRDTLSDLNDPSNYTKFILSVYQVNCTIDYKSLYEKLIKSFDESKLSNFSDISTQN